MERAQTLRGLVVRKCLGAVEVVTEEGLSVAAIAREGGAAPGRIVAVRREGDRFVVGETGSSPGAGPSASWDAVAGAWRIVLADLPAEAVLTALGEEDFSLRFAAEWELYHRGKTNLSLLVGGMASPNWRVRAGCAALMDHLADETCGAPLLSLLRDPHERVRRAALHSVSCEECKEEPLCVDWVPDVARLAESDRIVRVRRIATLMLGIRREDPRASLALHRLLADRDEAVRNRARWALDGKRPTEQAAWSVS